MIYSQSAIDRLVSEAIPIDRDWSSFSALPTIERAAA
jgi:hypothetical protein